jgi:endonuclease/exonuclease/phosphatase family metal-dependent hydrolase
VIGQAVGLQLQGAIQQGGQLRARKLLPGQEMASHPQSVVRALTWNLFHGRDFPPERELLTWRSRLLRVTESGASHAQVNRPLRDEFAAVLKRIEWDVALLQEAPPRWLAALGSACRASGALALTSRNELPALRGALAERNPDLIASAEGGSNMALVRTPGRIEEVRRLRLARRPERRALLLARVRLPAGSSLVVACMHLSVGSTGNGPAELVHAAEAAVAFAGSDPLLFGGDLNLRPARDPAPFAALAERFALRGPVGPKAIDHLLARGLEVTEPARALAPAEREVPGPRGLALRLSDHSPVTATFGMR